jgi:hypothetical protein
MSIIIQLGISRSIYMDWINSGSMITKDRSDHPIILIIRDLHQLKYFIKINREIHRISTLQILKKLEFDINEKILIKILTDLHLFHHII